MKKLSIVLSLLLAIVAIPALAEDGQTSGRGVRDDFEAKKAEIQGKIKENKDKMKEERELLKGEIKDKREEMKEDRKELRDDRQEDRQDKREDRREDRQDKREDRREDRGEKSVKVRADVAVRVLEATITRLETLATRIDSRIAKIGSTGTSTTEATGFVASARTDIGTAKTHIANIKGIDLSSDTASSTATSTNKVNRDKIKSEAKLAKEALVSAKQNLMKALNAIKRIEASLRKEGKLPVATSTATTTTP
ncbi:MAG TPA: hypothetical protein PLD99_00080 [Parcubacteria group bacterium]|nr:hypothetical protein [Parcubacteria group bacterium]